MSFDVIAVGGARWINGRHRNGSRWPQSPRPGASNSLQGSSTRREHAAMGSGGRAPIRTRGMPARRGGHQPPYWITYMARSPVVYRDLHATTPHGEVSLIIYHPSMQEALLERASAHGVEVKRGAKVLSDDQARRLVLGLD